MTLDLLRDEIERIDRDFVDLLRRRQECARRVVALKQADGIPLRNYTVERQVIERYARYCAEAGLDPQWGAALAQFLIARSVELQSCELDRRRAGERRRVLVIGGAGKMGQWCRSFFGNQGHEVDSFDIAADDPGHLAGALDAAEIVILSVPLAVSPAVLESVLACRPRGLLFDICSVKRDIAPLLRSAAADGLRVTSLHPLFGPDVRTLAGRNIVICPCGNPAADAEAAALFAETAANLVSLDLDDHDRLMSLTLGMSHAVNLLFARALTSSGAPFSELAAVASSTFSRQLETTRDVAGENMDLYFEIQRQCDHRLIYALLGSELRRLERLITDGEREQFLESMGESTGYFAVTVEEALHDHAR
jgi:chorismate mutase/prephenate dehydrogenase